MKKRSNQLPLLIVLAVLLLFSSCGALRKRPPSLPAVDGWQGPSGHVGEVRIILEDDIVVLDLEELDGLLDEAFLSQATTH
ncbi:MAG: hypothetical protein M0Q37_00665 [Sphaerochaeta sp.]|nr:hypothetical protein [Sphaerochaeta sp.]